MKKKWVFVLTGCVVSIGLLTGMGYVGATNYFKDKYAPNTWVNGVYCTGRTPADVNQELLQGLEAPTVTVTDAEGMQYSYDLADAGLTYDYSASLNAYQKHQLNNGWTSMLWQKNQIATGEAAFLYDESKVEEWWQQLPFVKAENTEPILEMKLDDEKGYVLYSTLEGHLNVDQALTKLVSGINDHQTEFSIADSDCYFDYEMTAAQEKTYQTWKELKELEQCGLTYDMGAEKIVFDEALMSKLIAKDSKGNPLKNEKGSYYYDLEAADAFMEELCEKYHTYGVERPFKTSRESGDVVMVKPGNFGTEIDVETEKAYLREVLTDSKLRKEKTNHVPTYLHETLVHGLDDTGGTYIEVDKLEQKIYYYQDGELMVTSGVVTGNLRTRHDTYEGAFYIQAKYKNRVLRGPGYASFVRRWMPIYKAIGLHDANWRKESEFGGETYKRNGSHGCVNMPDETTDIIFDHAEIGTPVFIFQ